MFDTTIPTINYNSGEFQQQVNFIVNKTCDPLRQRIRELELREGILKDMVDQVNDLKKDALKNNEIFQKMSDNFEVLTDRLVEEVSVFGDLTNQILELKREVARLKQNERIDITRECEKFDLDKVIEKWNVYPNLDDNINHPLKKSIKIEGGNWSDTCTRLHAIEKMNAYRDALIKSCRPDVYRFPNKK